MKLVISHTQMGLNYEGYGELDRKYLIQRRGASFTASLISGQGQHITATGRSPLEALQRAESIQTKIFEVG